MNALRSSILLPALLLAGCGTLPNGHRWGQDATLLPGWDRVQHAARAAISSPRVWAPAGAALLLQIDHADERISDWAMESTPIFGSTNSASEASDDLRDFSIVAFRATVLATPGGNKPGEWALSKLKGFGVQWGSTLAVRAATGLLKDATERTRPNERNDQSFPSGHTSTATVHSMLAYKNIEHLQVPGWTKATLKTGIEVVPYATGWARVEAGEHYPSDVLAGIALGNLFAGLINDAFLGVDSTDDLRMQVDYLEGDTLTLGLSRRF